MLGENYDWTVDSDGLPSYIITTFGDSWGWGLELGFCTDVLGCADGSFGKIGFNWDLDTYLGGASRVHRAVIVAFKKIVFTYPDVFAELGRQKSK